MNSVLKVTPEKLLEAAEKFSTAEKNIRTLTAEMVRIVESFKSVWQGEAATGFATRFNSLSDDMNRMYSMIREHSKDLMQMGNEYKQAENESANNAATLSTEAIS